jgi:hypothetical protein
MPQKALPQRPASGRTGEPSPQLPARAGRSRWAVRLIAIPLIGIIAALLYRGLQDHFFLPACDSDRATRTLADVLKELKLEPSRYAPITTVSSSKTQVVCNATLPLPDGGNVVIDYSFYWQGSRVNIKYSVARK